MAVTSQRSGSRVLGRYVSISRKSAQSSGHMNLRMPACSCKTADGTISLQTTRLQSSAMQPKWRSKVGENSAESSTVPVPCHQINQDMCHHYYSP